MSRQNNKIKMKVTVTISLFLFVLNLVGIAADSQPIRFTMEGKKKTDRSIVLNFVVDAASDEVFKLWTTVEGTKKFFGADAVITPRPGGAYEIYFLPRTEPRSDINSTKGAKLMWMKKGRELAFEWTMPPFASELNRKPLPTWVEVSFQSLANNPGKTHICVAHHGFKRGAKWDKAYEFFVRGWASILYRLDRLCSGMTSK